MWDILAMSMINLKERSKKRLIFLLRTKLGISIFEHEGNRVVVRKNLRDKATGTLVDAKKKWVVTSYDNNVPKSDKQSASTLATPESDEGGRAVASDAVS